MGFRLHSNEYFRGTIIEPDGERRELVVVNRGTRAGAVKATVIAAGQRGWDWRIELLREEQNEDSTAVTELAQWSEIAGDNLPPLTRTEVPGLH